MTGAVAGRRVLLTGGSAGIGAAVAARLLDEGAEVTVLDQRPLPPELSGRAAFVEGDVTDPSANRAAVDCASDADGRLDVFVGNAGVHDGGVGLTDADAAELAAVLERVMRIDVGGYLLGAQAAAPALRRSRGCMIFTLSDASFTASGNGAGAAYVAAKHAGLGLVRYLATTLAPDVRVNAVAPGGVITQLQAVNSSGPARSVFDDPAGVSRRVRALNPLAVMLSPEQVAQAYCYLASEASAGMTGEVLRLDGGLRLR